MCLPHAPVLESYSLAGCGSRFPPSALERFPPDPFNFLIIFSIWWCCEQTQGHAGQLFYHRAICPPPLYFYTPRLLCSIFFLFDKNAYSDLDWSCLSLMSFKPFPTSTSDLKPRDVVMTSNLPPLPGPIQQTPPPGPETSKLKTFPSPSTSSQAPHT